MNTICIFLFAFGLAWNVRASQPALPPESSPAAPPPLLVDLQAGRVSFVDGKTTLISGNGQPAKVGDPFPEKTQLKTGPTPVTEVTFADGSVMRLGENTKVSFLAKERVVRLEQGTILFHSPEGNGGITIQGGDSAGQVSGSTVMSTRDEAGNFSFFILESSGAGSLAGPTTPTTFLGAGQGATARATPGEAPEVLDVHIDAVRDISPLFQQIPTDLPSSEKIGGTTQQQSDDIQGDVKLLSSLENYKLTEMDPEGIALAMICDVGPDEMSAAKNILLRPLDTAAGTEAGSEQGSVVAVGAPPLDARQAEAQPLVAASSPPSTGDGPGGTDTAGGTEGGGGPEDTQTAAGGGAPPDTQPPLAPAGIPPVTTSPTPGLTTPI